MKHSMIPLLFALLFGVQLTEQTTNEKEIRISGNAYVTAQRDGARIGRNGLENWTDPESRIQTYVYFSKPQTIEITLNGFLPQGKARISFQTEHEKYGGRKFPRRQKVTLEEEIGRASCRERV